MYINFFKRLLDVVLSFVACIVLSPVLLIVALAVKLDSKGPVFFKQKRVAKGKTYFNILKFRTMYTETPKDMPTHLLKDPDAYITRVGRFLRKTSLDELPQLFNILKGDMAIVGPRPALWNQYDQLEARDKGKSNQIRPGLTGWAQIHGRDELEIDVKAAYDNEYAGKISLGMDIRCILGTVMCVLKQDGVMEGGPSAGKH